MAKTKDKQPELTLDDKGYFFDEMSEKQKGIYLHLKNVNDIELNFFAHIHISKRINSRKYQIHTLSNFEGI